MNDKIKESFDFSCVPPIWQLCFCEGCPQHEECLRFLAGQHVPDTMAWGPAIYPSAYRNGSCKYFKEIRMIKAAYGFDTLFKEVKQKHHSVLRNQIKRYLGGHGTYYRYHSGKRLLTPEQQQWILDLFNEYGYTDGLAFDAYRDVIDFSWGALPAPGSDATKHRE